MAIVSEALQTAVENQQLKLVMRDLQDEIRELKAEVEKLRKEAEFQEDIIMIASTQITSRENEVEKRRLDYSILANDHKQLLIQVERLNGEVALAQVGERVAIAIAEEEDPKIRELRLVLAEVLAYLKIYQPLARYTINKIESVLATR